MVESAAFLYCKPEVAFETRNHSIEGKQVLEVYIPPAEKKPVYAKDESDRWMAYVRADDENILAGIIQMQLWKEEDHEGGRLLEFTRKEQILLKTLSRSPGSTLTRIQRDTGFRRKELISLMTQLVRFDVVRMGLAGGKYRFSLKESPGE
jgi:hypothetical protein